MGKYLRKFQTQAEYEAAAESLEQPNVSLIEEGRVLFFNASEPGPEPVDMRIVTTFNVEDISEDVRIIIDGTNEYFSAIEIDGVEVSTLDDYYNFTETGEHTIIYTLTDTLIDTATVPDGIFSELRSMASVVIPEGFKHLGNNSFGACYGLSSVTIPSTIESIDFQCFDECSSLNEVIILSTVPPTIDATSFNYVPGYIYVPSESVNAYKTASEDWETYAEQIRAIPA